LQLSLASRILLALLVCAALLPAQTSSGPVETISDKPELSTQDVRNFIDPTLMISSIDYSFQSNFLLDDIRLYTHTVTPFWAVNHWTGFWADIPYSKFSVPGEKGPGSIGDVRIGGGVVVHENLENRFTSSVLWLEALAPTGDVDKGTSFGTWILAPGGGIAINPTNRFPIFITGSYLHSLESLRGPRTEIPGEDSSLQGLKVRSIELNIETVHILPKGFFLAAAPSFVFDLNKDNNFFSLGFGVGRALNKRLALTGGYTHYVAGTRSFNQAFLVGLQVLVGPDQELKKR
jgi:hypothetical protein